MFRVDRDGNQLEKLNSRSFSDLNIRERDHLQEWVANTPEALAEDLLIIQKEFDGFADTKERLDLLALDKNGCLVVIENKLDDSGRDVTWQALKYVAYCSTLTQKGILEIYQKYLDRFSRNENALENLCEFLEVEDLDEVVLNPTNEQRLVLIAANFRKEVTATVLWLLAHKVKAQCFRVVPYSFEDELFVDLQQIIPTPEASDFMIGMAEKDEEEKSVRGAQRRSEKLRVAFWTQLQEDLLRRDIKLFTNRTATTDRSFTCSTGVSGCRFGFVLNNKEALVALWFNRPNPTENKQLFDEVIAERSSIEKQFGSELNWLRLDDKRSSRVAFAHDFDSYNESSWPDIINWYCEHINKLERAFAEPLARADQRLKSDAAFQAEESTVSIAQGSAGG